MNSGIICNKSISDHQLIFSCFDSIVNLKSPLTTTNDKNSKLYEALNIEIKNTVLVYCNLKTDIHDDPNTIYDIFEDKLTTAIQKNTTVKQLKFNKFKHKKNPWMSEGLLKSIRFRDKMHLKLKSSRQTAEQYATLKTNIKTYNKIIKRLIRKLKRQYMARKFEQCKSNIKKTWNILNDVLGRTKRDTTSEFFLIDQGKKVILNCII